MSLGVARLYRLLFKNSYLENIHKWWWRRDTWRPLFFTPYQENILISGLDGHGPLSFLFSWTWHSFDVQWSDVKTRQEIFSSLQPMWVLWKEVLVWSLLDWRWQFHVCLGFGEWPGRLHWCIETWCGNGRGKSRNNPLLCPCICGI